MTKVKLGGGTTKKKCEREVEEEYSRGREGQ